METKKVEGQIESRRKMHEVEERKSLVSLLLAVLLMLVLTSIVILTKVEEYLM